MNMHFLLVIPPVSPRGRHAHYLWVLMKWLHRFDQAASTVLLPPQYLEAFEDQSRWERQAWSCQFHDYTVFGEIGSLAQLSFYPEALCEPGGAPHARFRRNVLESVPELRAYYASQLAQLRQAHGEVCVVTWLNCASLRQACLETGCRLVFNEIGPLRRPYYQQTAYWDRQGVNGETSVQELWASQREALRARAQRLPLPADEYVWSVLATTGRPVWRDEYPLGIALQVEDDSNSLVFSQGWDSLSLLQLARQEHDESSVLLRCHPNGHALYSGRIDRSTSALAFLSKVERIWTINSSLGMEAMFWGRTVRIFGDSPVSVFFGLDEEDRQVFNLWFFLCYLMPYECLFDPEYYAWRLAGPAPEALLDRHVDLYLARHAEFSSHARPVDAGDSSLLLPGASGRLVEELVAAREQVAEREDWVRDRDIWIAERDHWIRERDGWVTQREAEIGALRRRVLELEHAHACLEEVVAEQNRLIGTLRSRSGEVE